MFHHDRRTEEQSDAIRSDPVPVPRPPDDDNHSDPHAGYRADDTRADTSAGSATGGPTFGTVDRDHDGVDDREEMNREAGDAGRDPADASADGHSTEADVYAEGDRERTDADAAFGGEGMSTSDNDRDGAEDGVDDRVDDRSDTHDDGGTAGDPAAVDADRDGIGDRAKDADAGEPHEPADVYAEGDRERTDATSGDATVNDEPVAASPLDTDTGVDAGAGHGGRDGVDGRPMQSGAEAMHDEAERDEASEDRPARADELAYPGTIMVPTAFGAATIGGAAAAAAMAADRTDTRRDAENVEHLDADRADTTGADVDAATGETDTTDQPAEMMPGEAEAPPVTALVAVDAAQGFRDRWREVQLRFVDDPRAAAAEAQSLAEEAADALVAALNSMRGDLGGWEATESGDTEQLRVVVRRYRDFLDRLLET